MRIRIRLSAAAKGHWYEYAIRFVLGGAVTVLAGLIAARFGPIVGGLFLAFPAIFPASATLVDKHERMRKESVGLQGTRRGRQAAVLEAAGTALGSLGLVAFGAIVWHLVSAAPGLGLGAATVGWLAASVTLWGIRRRIRLARGALMRGH